MSLDEQIHDSLVSTLQQTESISATRVEGQEDEEEQEQEREQDDLAEQAARPNSTTSPSSKSTNSNSNYNNNNFGSHNSKHSSKSMDSQQMHVCRLCDKLLSSSSSLDRHMLTHSGERPFVCKRCHMTFTTNGNMHRHMRTHLHKDSLARQQQEQQLKSLVALGQSSHSTTATSPPTVTYNNNNSSKININNNSNINNNNHHHLDITLAHNFNPLGPSSVVSAPSSDSPFGQQISHLVPDQPISARLSPLQDHFQTAASAASLGDQLVATFKQHRQQQQQQQPIRTRRAHYQYNQQQQLQQHSNQHHQNSTASSAHSLLSLTQAGSAVSPSSNLQCMFSANGNDAASLAELAAQQQRRRSGGAGGCSPAPVTLQSSVPAAAAAAATMATESQTAAAAAAAAAKFLRHHHQSPLDPEALMMGALQGDQLGLESVKAVMFAAAAAAAAAAVQSQQQPLSAGIKRYPDEDEDEDDDNNIMDDAATQISGHVSLDEDETIKPNGCDLSHPAQQSFSRGKRRKQVNPRSTRVVSALHQSQVVSPDLGDQEQAIGLHNNNDDCDESDQDAEQERPLSSMSCDIKSAHGLRSFYGINQRDEEEDEYEGQNDGEDDDGVEDSELFKTKFTDRVLGQTSLATVTSTNVSSGRLQVKCNDSEAINSDKYHDVDKYQREADDKFSVEMSGGRESVIKRESEDVNNNAGDNKICQDDDEDMGSVVNGDDRQQEQREHSGKPQSEVSEMMMHSDDDDDDDAGIEDDDDDDEASGSSSNVNMNLSENSSTSVNADNQYHHNQQRQQLQQHQQQCSLQNPLTSINGEVIEDISQSYVKTANPNAARKGGKRNRHCYKCKLCTYSSVDRCTLVRHLRIHSGERPYICGICRYAFTTKANCERHVRKRHKKQYNSLGGAGGGGVKGSNGGGRSLIITDHTNHQTIPVKVNPVAAQTISQTLQRIQEKQQNSQSNDDDLVDNIERIQQSNQRQNQHHQQHSHPARHQHEQQVHNQQQQPSDHVNTRSNNETTTSLTTSGTYKQSKRKHRNDDALDNNNHHLAPYQRRRLADKQQHNYDLFSTTRLSNGSNLLCNQQQPQSQPNSFPGQTSTPEITSTNELFASLMAQLQQVTNQHQNNVNGDGGGGGTTAAADALRLTRETPTATSATFLANMLSGGKALGADGQQLLNSAQQRSLLLPKQLSQQFTQLRNHNSQTPFFIRRNPFDLFNPIDLAAQALDLSCKFQSK